MRRALAQRLLLLACGQPRKIQKNGLFPVFLREKAFFTRSPAAGLSREKSAKGAKTIFLRILWQTMPYCKALNPFFAPIFMVF